MSRILVTGGAGMIGSNLVKSLVGRGERVLVADNLWRGTEANLVWSLGGENVSRDFVKVDFTKEDSFAELFGGIEVVYHLADQVAGIEYVFGNEHSIFRNNVLINSNVLRASIRAEVKRIIYVGSACSYPAHLTTGSTMSTPLSESDAYPANPESAYGWSKLMGEYEIALAEAEGLIEASVLRLHNVYGFPTELSSGRSQVIPALIRKVIESPSSDFEVWGSGLQRRSFVYVDDVVDALLLAQDIDSNVGPIQIGPEQSTSISEVAHLIASLSPKKIEPVFNHARPEGDGDRVGDISKAKNLLGWKPKVSLEDGLDMVYSWALGELGANNAVL